MKTVMDISAAAFLCLCGLQDIRWKAVSRRLLLIGGAAGAVFFCLGLYMQAGEGGRADFIMEALRFGTGAALLSLSRLFKGLVGEGDGWAFLILGCFLDAWNVFEIFVIALFFSAIVAGILLIRKRKSRKDRIPFLPFAAAACIFVLLLPVLEQAAGML